MKKRGIRFGAPPKKRAPTANFDQPVKIDSLTLDGRGVGRNNGKTFFAEGALPGESVRVKLEKASKRFDEVSVEEILESSTERITPPCPHYGRCGGCDLQHLNPSSAVELKQTEILGQLSRFSGLIPNQISSPIQTEEKLGYRRSARIGINQRDNGELILGFRRRSSNQLIDIDHCPVLTENLNRFIAALREVLSSEDRIKQITQLLISAGDNSLAAQLRITKRLSDSLTEKLRELAEAHSAALSLDAGEGNLTQIYSPDYKPAYIVDAQSQLRFEAPDFMQINARVNQKMIERVIEWMQPSEEDQVLDLFSGLGNFSIPLAKRSGSLCSVEGSHSMVERCQHNAELNGLTNLRAIKADLSQNTLPPALAGESFSLILLDPPRAGASELIQALAAFKPRALVYIACEPASLVRDGKLLSELGYQMKEFCVADMFPQTHHIESLALFTR